MKTHNVSFKYLQSASERFDYIHNAVESVRATLDYVQERLPIGTRDAATQFLLYGRPFGIHLKVYYSPSGPPPMEIRHWYTDVDEWTTASVNVMVVRKWSSASLDSSGNLVLSANLGRHSAADSFRAVMTHYLPKAMLPA